MYTSQLPQSSRRPLSSSRSPTEIALRYPARWQTPVNPHAGVVEQRTFAWLKEVGALTDAKVMNRFLLLSVGAYGGWPFPVADEEQLETITRFLTLWILYDDSVEGMGEQRESLMAAAVRGAPDAKLPACPELQGLWEVAQRYLRTMSPRWIDRHTERLVVWLRSLSQESCLAKRYRGVGVLPSTAEYLAMRVVNVGVLPTLDFIEYVTERELPEAVLRLPSFESIEVLAAEVVTLVNDLFGFEKDRGTTWLNAVASFARDTGAPLRQSIVCIAEMHDLRVRQIIELEETLLEEARDHRPLVEEWLTGMHHVLHGFARWHESAPRYSRLLTLDDGSRFRLVVRYA